MGGEAKRLIGSFPPALVGEEHSRSSFVFRFRATMGANSWITLERKSRNDRRTGMPSSSAGLFFVDGLLLLWLVSQTLAIAPQH